MEGSINESAKVAFFLGLLPGYTQKKKKKKRGNKEMKVINALFHLQIDCKSSIQKFSSVLRKLLAV